jgi:hypothetical protein
MIALALLASLALTSDDDSPSYVPTSAYVERQVEGWTALVNRDLLEGGDHEELGRDALRLLESKLDEIGRAVPPPALAELRKVRIWLGVNDGHAPCAEYHPSRDWLAEHGFNPDKARAVEIGNARRFLDWSKDQPAMILHELAHAYHHQVLGFDHRGIRDAHRRAVESKAYDAVLHINGRTERAYALNDPQEFFAEASEAYFGTNDFFPFVRAELRQHDPETATLLKELWEEVPLAKAQGAQKEDKN